jgi:DNA-binding SARP family transcriptional activator
MEFRLLGPVEVWHGGRPVRVGGRKERAVLAVLLLNANRAVTSDRLVDEVWGDAPAARASLQVRIANLRRAIRPAAGERILTLPSGYAARVEGDELDLRRFERLLGEGQDALRRHDAAEAAETLGRALALWRGPPLADFSDEPFAGPAARRLEELRLLAVELRGEAELACGQHATLVPELELLVAEHPYHEGLARQLMLALYRSSRQTEALAVYRTTRAAFVSGLGIEPGPALRELEQAILRQDVALEPWSASAPERSLVVAPRDERDLEPLLELAKQLARKHPHEVVIVGSGQALGELDERFAQARVSLAAAGISARAAAFTSRRPGVELVRIAASLDAALLCVGAPADLLDDRELRAILADAPCDVAVLVARAEAPAAGPVLVPFTGADHDWVAVELAGWLASAWGEPLVLVGPGADATGPTADASVLLAHASLAVQRALGIAARPLLIAPSPDELISAADDAAIVVVGVPDGWRRNGLGRARGALVHEGRTPALLVRRGVRPGGLAPGETLTRFTWTLGPSG